MRGRFLIFSLAAALAGCVGGGPSTKAILQDENAVVVRAEQDTPFVLLGVNSATAKMASQWLERSRDRSFIADAGTGPIVIGAGDILDISIVSTSESGYIDLTNSTLSPISTTALPQQEVGTDGRVSVPPIGRVNARGLSAQGLERTLELRLGEVLVAPSVIVRIAERRSARVSVLGAVEEPGTYAINQTNMRLVEMIALAGGPSSRAEDLRVSLSRRGRTGRTELNRVYENPGFNVQVQPGDVISIEQPATQLTVLGAGGVNATLKYDDPKISLADALGRSGGLLNRRADRRGVFIYREVPVAAVQAFGVDVTGFSGQSVPVIFNLDLSKPQALFAAKDFTMGDDDLIYISDSANEEIASVFAVFGTFVPLPSEFVADAAFSN